MDKAWAVNNSMAHEPSNTRDATQQVVHILDAKYEKADLQSVVSTCTHLSLQDQNKLLELLTEYEELFDGTLGDWKTDHVSLQLKEGVTRIPRVYLNKDWHQATTKQSTSDTRNYATKTSQRPL
eukprot:CCRYP_018716-RA/>CCRYP_018716-RA protein AED:0.36 eAED:1.00 QI:0/-1/0/1/-1/1/1/0/123